MGDGLGGDVLMGEDHGGGGHGFDGFGHPGISVFGKGERDQRAVLGKFGDGLRVQGDDT